MEEDGDSERLTDVMASARTPDGLGDDDADSTLTLGPGSEVGGYVIDGQLGQGGMGIVYAATHPLIGKRAAIKVLRAEVSKSQITIDRFVQEARAVNQIGHPNIVDIFAYGALPDGRAYHVMDLLVGESLRRRLRRSPVEASEAASIIDETASALTAAHECGFVHRDLKPDNIFLVTHDDRWPEVKLLDFGLAKLMPEMGVAAFQTKAGVMLGTPEYMSPEQARGQGVDYRTDIYALGVLTFEILAGQRPFASLGDSFATLQQHAEEQPPSIGDLVAELPPELVQLCDAMLAKTPAARPSLAAVRTVIKRLRSTKLPTHSMAGASLEGVQRTSGQVRALGVLAMSPSRLGAEASLPGDSKRITAPPLTTPGVGIESVRQQRQQTAPPGASSSGLAPHKSSPNLGATKFGVPPPPVPVPPPRSARVTAQPAQPAASRTWVVLATILVIAAAVALVVVLTS